MNINLIPCRPYFLRGNILKFVMRTSIFLSSLFVFGFSPGISHSQKENIEITKTATYEVAEIFDLIVAQTDYNFLYTRDLFDNIPEVRLAAGTMRTDDLLKKCLGASAFTYNFKGDSTIVLQKKQTQHAIIDDNDQQQDMLRGIISDQSGLPLPGVNVVVERPGSDIIEGTYSGFNGDYTAIVSPNATITFSMIGFKTQQIQYVGQKVLNIVMQEDINELEEVQIVSTGYQKISKERSTGSADVVSEKTLENYKNQRTTNNVLDLLNGTIPGLGFATNQTQFGPGTKTLSIRGRTAFSLDNNNPLVVVDGFEIIGDDEAGVREILRRYNPEDIESITVLKDAAAASIWGAKAANGVIVINTKQGKRRSETTTSFTSTLSLQEHPDYSKGYLASVASSLALDKLRVDNNMESIASPYWFTSPNNEGAQTYQDLNNGIITQQQADAIINKLRQTNTIQEYSDLFLDTGLHQRHTLNVSHGGDHFGLYSSFGYDKEETTQKGEESRLFTGNLNINTDISKGITLGARVNYTNGKELNNAAKPIEMMQAYEQFLDKEGNYIFRDDEIHKYTRQELEATGIYPYGWGYNEKQEFDNMDNRTHSNSIDLGLTLKVKLFEGLDFETAYNFQNSRSEGRNLLNENRYNTRYLINTSVIFIDHDDDPTTPAVFDPTQQYDGFVLPKGNILQSSYRKYSSSGGRAQLNYSRFFGPEQKHFVTALLGVDYRELNSELNGNELYSYNANSRTNYLFIDLTNRYMDSFGYERRIEPPPTVYKRIKDRFLANYVNGAYTYNDKYTLSSSWRLDDSNLFGSSPKYRNVPLWSVGAKWQAAKESFMQNIDWIDQLDVRISYGTGGAIDKSTHPFLAYRKNQDQHTGEIVGNIVNYKNDELRWSTTSTTNMGLDFVLYAGKLSGSFEWYRKYTDDLLTEVPINPTNGFSSQTRNFGEVSNKGIDLRLTYNPIDTDTFGWSMTGLLNYNKNKVERIGDITQNIAYFTNGRLPILGEALRTFYHYKWAGLSATGAPQVFDAKGNITPYTTDITDVNALEKAGQRDPKYSGSFQNTIRYKGFSLYALVAFQLGHVFRKKTIDYAEMNYSRTPPHKDFDQRWQNPGDEKTTYVPAYNPDSGQNFNYGNYFENSDLHTLKADHIRLSAVSLNYDFNQQWLRTTFINSINMGINVQNLGILWAANKYNIDPLLNNFRRTAPNEPIYSINARIKF